MIIFPKQRLSYKDKVKDDFKWAKSVLDYLRFTASSEEYESKKKNYKIYNNEVSQEDFAKECNTLGFDVGQVDEEVLAYNKVSNKINTLLGEELKRPFNHTAYLIDSNGIREKNMKKTEMLKSWITSKLKEYELMLRNQFNPSGQDPEEEQERQELEQRIKEELDSLLPPKELDVYFKTGYLDSREIASNKILNYLYKVLDLKDKKNDAFKHALLSGEEIVWVGVRKNKPVLDSLNSLGVFYHKSSDTKFIQKGLYAGYKKYMTYAEMLDNYGMYLSDEDLEKIEKNMSAGFIPNHGFKSEREINLSLMEQFDFRNDNAGKQGSYGSNRNDLWLVTHIEWKSQRKVGFLSCITEDGEKEDKIVDEEYKVPYGAKKESFKSDREQKTIYYWSEDGIYYVLEWKWIPEVWEGTILGGDIYCNMGPKEYQYFSVDNPFESELGYYGLAYSNMNAKNQSLMDRMKNYYSLYLIVMHKLKKLIARDTGKVFHFDLSMVTPELGLEKTMYYLREMNIDFYNPLENAEKPGSHQRGKVTSASDLSNMNQINNYIMILDKIDQQISDVSGVSKSREGQTMGEQSVGNARQDLMQSSTITEIYFHLHNLLWEKALTGLLSVSRKYFKKTKQKFLQYVLDDLSYETIQLFEDDLEDNEVGVFLVDSIKENEIFQTLKALAQPLIQNDKARFSDIIRLLEADSIADLKREIRSFEDMQQKQAQEQMQAQQQAQDQGIQAQFQREVTLKQMELDSKERIAEIDVFKFQKTLDANQNGVPDPLEIERLKIQKDKLSFDKELKEKELKLKEKIASQKNQNSKE